MKIQTIIAALFSASVLAAPAESDIDIVKRVLQTPKRDEKEPALVQWANDLKFLGDRAIPTLATLLEDPKFGYNAADVMLYLDGDSAAPLIFATMPNSDRNVQQITFKHVLRRFNRGEVVVPSFFKEMHDAARRCLEAQIPGDVAELAVYALGVTGTEKDFPLLKSYQPPGYTASSGRNMVRNAVEAVLARLGDEGALISIEFQLSLVPTKPLVRPEADTLTASILKAGYSRNRRFVPFLVRMLDCPPPPYNPRNDHPPPSPRDYAGAALEQIIYGASPDELSTKRNWRLWWDHNQIGYTK